MHKRHSTDFSVVDIHSLSASCYQIVLKHPDTLPLVAPGQFVQVQLPDSANSFLRRPISIHDADFEANTLTLLIRKAGKGTELLSHVKVGDSVNLLYPLGNGFDLSLDKIGNNPLLIGGGVGIAPLYMAAKALKAAGANPKVLLGARNEADLLKKDDFAAITETECTTEDASFGTKGFVTDHVYMKGCVHQFTSIIVCGPMPMMRAIARVAEAENIPCQVSLENKMACGIGACLCCVTETTDGHNTCVCTQGPVFDSNDVKW
ncbi:MAG: dihydroorotate dehydrogenase electron transfer subunit [Bacteroidales bacterium]|nr:dihydroorotate dehydrogenase electron transfer subunit [Bacteroidales bacterium]